MELKTGEVEELLRKKYKGDAYAFFTGVRNQTGYGRTVVRTADALAMSLWPSNGLELIGHEIKVSRTDWLKELRDPSKSAEIARYCHRWYLVAGASGIVRMDELPTNWGLMVANGSGFRTVKPAPLLSPEPISYEFLAAILRQASRADVSNVAINKSWSDGYESGKKATEASYRTRLDSSLNELRRLRESVYAFRHNIEESTRIVRTLPRESIAEMYRRMKSHADEESLRLQRALSDLDRLPPSLTQMLEDADRKAQELLTDIETTIPVDADGPEGALSL